MVKKGTNTVNPNFQRLLMIYAAHLSNIQNAGRVQKIEVRYYTDNYVTMSLDNQVLGQKQLPKADYAPSRPFDTVQIVQTLHSSDPFSKLPGILNGNAREWQQIIISAPPYMNKKWGIPLAPNIYYPKISKLEDTLISVQHAMNQF